MAPMNRNRNRDHKKTAARRRGKNLSRLDYKYSGSDGSRIRKKVAGHKLELFSGRNRNGGKIRKMGIGRFSRMGKEDRRSAESDELRTKKYIRKALQLGLSAGYLIPDENSESHVLRVVSDIGNFGQLVEEGSGSDEKLDNSLTGAGRNRVGRGAAGKTAVKRLATKNRRQNMPKRVRSRTKSPARPAAQKRRRKRSDSRGKVKARIQKRKRMPGAKNEPRTRKNEDDDEEDDKDDGKDEDDEPNTGNNENKNSNDENKKLPVAGRPSSIAPKSDNDSTTSTKQKNNDKEASDNERSSEEGGDEEDEEVDYQEQAEGLPAEEDTNENNEEDQNAEN